MCKSNRGLDRTGALQNKNPSFVCLGTLSYEILCIKRYEKRECSGLVLRSCDGTMLQFGGLVVALPDPGVEVARWRLVLPAHLAPVWGRRPGQCHQSAGGLARPLGLHTVRQWGQRGWVFIGAPVNRANICRWRGRRGAGWPRLQWWYEVGSAYQEPRGRWEVSSSGDPRANTSDKGRQLKLVSFYVARWWVGKPRNMQQTSCPNYNVKLS